MSVEVIRGPREAFGVSTPDEYRAWARRLRGLMHKPPRLLPASASVMAHLSDGRWCVDCATAGCNGAALVDRDWAMGICADCGTEYAVAFPAVSVS